MFVYFNLCFYHLVREAPALGIDRLLYGTAVYQGKMLRGCSMVPTRLFLRPARAVTRVVGKSVVRFHHWWYQRKLHGLYKPGLSPAPERVDINPLPGDIGQ